METPSYKELNRPTLEKAITYLKEVEERYKNGEASQGQIMYVANKIQELFFEELQRQGKIGTNTSYEDYAKLNTIIDSSGEEALWSEFKPETSEVDTEDVSTYTTKLKLDLAKILTVYRQNFSNPSQLALQASTIMQNPDALPSEIIEMANLLITQTIRPQE